MSQNEEILKTSLISSNVQSQQANDRTFLSWLRLSISIMGFGFVIVKFAIFLEEVKHVLSIHYEVQKQHILFYNIAGIVIIALGILLAILGYIRYVAVKKDLSQNLYNTRNWFMPFAMFSILLIGGILTVYLIV